MCNVEEDIEDLKQFSKQKPPLNKTICKKCGDKSILLLQKKDPFCRKCFLEYCDHKFRSTIGKTKKIKHGDKVLLAYSGGRKSSALLQMTKQALASASVKQISFVPGILFIDESAVAPDSTEAQQHVDSILAELKSCEYPVFVSSLEMANKVNSGSTFYCSLSDWDSLLPRGEDSQTWVKDCVDIMSLSAKLDFIKHLRNLLMTKIALQTGYDYLFVGDSASCLAVDLLTNISLGRGSQISSETNFFDARFKVPVCRPVREFLDKEIMLYNHLHDCSYSFLPNLLTKTDAKASVQRLTEKFISSLQEDFPATVFTIFRTGGKLSKHDFSLEEDKCFLCMSKLDNVDPDPCSALEALKLSQNLSQSSSATSNPSSVDETIRSRLSAKSDVNDMSVLKLLCHGCSMPFRNNIGKLDFLPFQFRTNCVQMERQEMKKEFEDLLINEGAL